MERPGNTFRPMILWNKMSCLRGHYLKMLQSDFPLMIIIILFASLMQTLKNTSLTRSVDTWPEMHFVSKVIIYKSQSKIYLQSDSLLYSHSLTNVSRPFEIKEEDP